jgi:hypothetical protein
MPMTKVAALGLPSVDKGCSIASLDFCNLLRKCIVSRMRQQLRDTSIFAKPLTTASPNNLIFVAVYIRRSERTNRTFHFVVHSSTLQRHARATLQDTIPWQMWGPTTTRWFQSVILPARDVCGQRCLLRGPTSMEIWDFNQYRVRCLGKDFAMDSEASCVSVETEPSCVKSRAFEGRVYSSLPYVKLKLKELEKIRYGATCLDDDRILHRRVSPSHPSPLLFLFFDDIILQQRVGLEQYVVDHLYFG